MLGRVQKQRGPFKRAAIGKLDTMQPQPRRTDEPGNGLFPNVNFLAAQAASSIGSEVAGAVRHHNHVCTPAAHQQGQARDRAAPSVHDQRLAAHLPAVAIRAMQPPPTPPQLAEARQGRQDIGYASGQ